MSLIGYYTTSYRNLVSLFGKPSDGGCYKVSTEWNVTYKGKTYSIYDYKETNLYDEELPSVEEFRRLPYYTWHIGGWGDPTEFIEFLKFKLHNYDQDEKEECYT